MIGQCLMEALVKFFVHHDLSRHKTILAAAAAGALCALTNTVAAICIAILLGKVPSSIIPAVIPQALIEMVGCAIIIPIIVVAVDAAMKARR